MNKYFFIVFILFFIGIPISNAIEISPGVIFSSNQNKFVVVHNAYQTTDTIIVAGSNISVNFVTYMTISNGSVVLNVDDYQTYKFTASDSITENMTFYAVGSGKKFALYGDNYTSYVVPDKWYLTFSPTTTRLWLVDGGIFRGLMCPTSIGDSTLLIASVFFFLLFVLVASINQESIIGIFGAVGLLCCSWVVAMCSALLGSVFVAISIGFLLHFIFVRQPPRKLY